MLVSLATFALPTWAASTTVTLSVPTMDCPVCPITVKKALSKVAGVEAVTVSLDRREAIVTFDDVKTTVETLTRATRDSGYRSSLAERKP
ncbi:MAG: mercury resistance system periplasmic binding protein MerP [Steroidobacteraceae bacterium]|uniref:mercury resistance system periplasmic binding protein MerP n=1 Tax=Aromatoleum sp. (strain CIB) TaxID=198107 RepID=UPI0012EE5B5F|nr:mercury resistance system periplasmic binding protein MerP [Azoarcus sp. CIB]MCM2313501.1 mercury resistance system periplasmic binding protein MerP [Steroidobacteraceae bacterium]